MVHGGRDGRGRRGPARAAASCRCARPPRRSTASWTIGRRRRDWAVIDRRGTKANFNSNSQPYDASAAVCVAGDRLLVAYGAPTEKDLLKNSGETPNALFKTGGCLDLMLATDAGRQPATRQPPSPAICGCWSPRSRARRGRCSTARSCPARKSRWRSAAPGAPSRSTPSKTSADQVQLADRRQGQLRVQRAAGRARLATRSPARRSAATSACCAATASDDPARLLVEQGHRHHRRRAERSRTDAAAVGNLAGGRGGRMISLVPNVGPKAQPFSQPRASPYGLDTISFYRANGPTI